MGNKGSKDYFDENIFDNMRKKFMEYNNDEGKINKSSFEYISVIGKGGYGRVWKVYAKKVNKYYALKEMSKAKIIDRKSVESIKFERDLLSRMNHP